MLKRLGERALVGSGVAGRFARRHPPRRVVLAYHNVLPEGTHPAGDRSLHLPRVRFAAQLDLLRREARVVSLTEILAPDAAARADGRPEVAITFDDAYAGALAAGIPELASRAMPATICVAPAFLGGRTFWWDALAAPGSDLDPATREMVLAECRGEDATAREWAAARGRPAGDGLPWPFRCCTGEELGRALAEPGITVASHTWSHPNLARLGPDEAQSELGKSFEWLASHGERAVPVVTYPYGLETAAVRSLAAAAGYHAAFRVDGGALSPGGDRFALPRLNVPAGLSADGLLLRLAGLLGS